MDQVGRIIVLGDPMIDRWVTVQPWVISAESPTIVYRIIDKDIFCPGGAANVLYNLLQLDMNVCGVFSYGENKLSKIDKFRDRLVFNSNNKLEDIIIKTRFIDVRNNFQVSRMDSDLLVLDKIKPIETNLVDNLLKSGDITAVVISDYNKGSINRDVVDCIYYYKSISKKSFKIFADIKKPSPDEIEAIYGFDRHIDFVFPNKVEYDNAHDIFSKISYNIIVTRGIEGHAIIYPDGSEKSFSAYTPLTFVNACGAGDVFVAGFVCGCMRGYGIEDSGMFASKAAAIAVGHRYTASITLNQLEDINV